MLLLKSVTYLLTLTHANEDSIYEMHSLSNQMMEVVTKTNDFPKEKFKLSNTEADLVVGVAKNDMLIGDYLANVKSIEECEKLKKDEEEKKKLAKAFDERNYRIAAYTIYSDAEFVGNSRLNYDKSNYSGYMSSLGHSTGTSARMNWSAVLKRASVLETDSYETKIDKLQKLFEKEINSTIPPGVIAAEFVRIDLMKNPDNWKSYLKQSKNLMDFDQKMRLVADLGERMGNDYNYNRTGTGPASEGIVEIEKLLKNLGKSEPGGVCRDIAHAQTQMLRELGVNQAYTVAYVSNRGGHATVIAVDPNDKNKVMKLNYGELYEDDGKKGTAALDQDSSLPNVGLQYRIYDNEGKPVASVPTELTAVFREVTGRGNPFSGRAHNVYKADFGTNGFGGSLFSGRTSTGENVDGVALFGGSNSKYLEMNAGGALYKANADKKYYEIDQQGLYLFTDLGLKATVYENDRSKLNAGVGMSTEVMMLKAESTSKTGGSKSKSDLLTDIDQRFYTKADYELDLSDKDKIKFGSKVIGRVDKSHVADEGSRSLHYDSTIITSEYDRQWRDDLRFSVGAAATISRYGESLAVSTSLIDGANKYSVGGNIPSGRAPSFFEDQAKVVKFGYERKTKSGWNFQLDFENNFDTDNKKVMGKIEKRF